MKGSKKGKQWIPLIWRNKCWLRSIRVRDWETYGWQEAVLLNRTFHPWQVFSHLVYKTWLSSFKSIEWTTQDKQINSGIAYIIGINHKLEITQTSEVLIKGSHQKFKINQYLQLGKWTKAKHFKSVHLLVFVLVKIWKIGLQCTQGHKMGKMATHNGNDAILATKGLSCLVNPHLRCIA